MVEAVGFICIQLYYCTEAHAIEHIYISLVESCLSSGKHEIALRRTDAALTAYMAVWRAGGWPRTLEFAAGAATMTAMLIGANRVRVAIAHSRALTISGLTIYTSMQPSSPPPTWAVLPESLTHF